ncbi:MAG: adenylate/guanylate cyclase domain-containing protein, partial [Desulfovibrionaceae bacterium]
QPDHALRACKSAVRQIEVLEELNASWPPEKRIAIGIGINSGVMTVGNMGSQGRMNYTVMGDNVNLASRLEGLTKTYGVSILISKSTQEQVAEEYWTRTIDLVRVKGKKDAVEIFELQARITEPQPMAYMPEYLEMVEAYRRGAFQDALAKAEELAAEHPEDKVCGIYHDRLQELSKNPPENWDGVYTFTTK